MGRALHTNFNARFKCDALKVRFYDFHVVGSEISLFLSIDMEFSELTWFDDPHYWVWGVKGIDNTTECVTRIFCPSIFMLSYDFGETY